MTVPRLPSLLALVVVLAVGAPASAGSVVRLGDDPRLGDLTVTAFATGLSFPTGMVALPDGSILVATSAPGVGGYFDSTGELLRLTDHNEDGVADGAGTLLATGLPGTLVSLALAGDLVLTTSAAYGDEQIVLLRKGETWRDPLDPAGALRLLFDGFEHQSYGLAVRPSPDVEGSYDVVFNVGAWSNDADGRSVRIEGVGVDAELVDASLYRMTVTDDGDVVTTTEPELIAAGLRNAAAIAFDPDTGDLLITDNGIDTPANRIVALSADALYRLPADEVGGAVEDYGFPDAYVDSATGETAGQPSIAPEVVYRPVAGSEAEGVASVALTPAGFPDALRGVVAGFHGQYDLAGVENEENPLRWSDEATGESIELFANADPGIGHIDGLLVTDRTLYAADLCAGSLTGTAPCGAIYAVRAGT